MRKLYSMLLLAVNVLMASQMTAQDCTVFNMIGSASQPFFQISHTNGRAYVRFDPSADNSLGNPGCNTSYPFLVQKVQFNLVDAGYFSPGEGAGTLTYRIRLYNLNNPANPCSGVGPMLASSPNLTLTTPGGTNVHEISHTFNQIVNNSFFAAYEIISWTGDQFQVPFPMRNTQSIPTCRQYYSQNGGTLIEDHQDFFGFIGWLDCFIEGEGSSVSCVLPTIEYTAICNPATPQQFFIYANTTALGSGAPYTLSNSFGGAPINVSATGQVYVGAFPNNTNVVVTATSAADPTCTISSSTITLNCATVSVSEMPEIQFADLFPNPAKGKVNISTANLSGGLNIRVFDIAGKMVLQQQQNIAGDFVTLSIDSLHPGIYSFLLENNGNQAIKKLVIH